MSDNLEDLFEKKVSKLKQQQRKRLVKIVGVLLLIIFIFIGFANNTRLFNKPTPPVVKSPWPWKDRQTIHPSVANMPSKVETSIKSVAEYIAQQESDPYLRIKALHDYVVSRVTYDLDVLKTAKRPPQDAETVFHTHIAVCEGYANLFRALGRSLNMDVEYIKGKIRKDLAPLDLIPPTKIIFNPQYDWTLHAWNAVKVLDNWQLVDTTWDDSTSSDTSYNANYLMLPPEAMIVSHFPEQSHWQLLHLTQDKIAFEKKPILTPEFFAEELVLISPNEHQTNVQKVAVIRIKSPVNYQQKIVAVFTKTQAQSFLDLFLRKSNQFAEETRRQDLKLCQSQRNAQGETQISCQFQERGDYQVFVYSIGRKNLAIAQFKFHAA
ncbi:transglutaminase domain-containing protein [Iningainema tapete]|uniref:Transglutaminase-like domain-containing protein n=1 Tax=Iningainema tapete BLCC-T55 TaxID=2748662 RepID=A0A8J7C9R9_9CYAN|nr:transglutaminase domain-containing protein [Iningainema tapete]MBD2778439.1 hypothetical protein [Iningainema tapete BLCC-T55]